ncbi:phage head closure protein [Virgibacillus sp. CBA3643]|uniref:phage head closure protein n=1 Tax=Virgibacillus sp. CBA3643 TaxID=2942278 RepID=UPI0035A30860
MVGIVQRQTVISDGQGGESFQWSDHLTVDGTLDKLNGDEVIASEKLGILSSHIFILFEILDIKRTDRMVIDDMIYQIKDVDNPNNLNRQLEITLEYTGDQYEV